MRNLIRLTPAAVLLLVAAACNDSIGPNSLIDDTETADIVLEADATAGSIIFAQVLLGAFGDAGDITVSSADIREFSRSRDCPLGGSITMDGSIERTVTADGAEFNASAEGAWNDCMRGNRRNDHTHSISGTFSVVAFRKVDGDRKPVGPQTTTKSGSFTVTRDDGESRSCDYNVTSTRLPDENKRTVVGTVCGREINREITWTPSDG